MRCSVIQILLRNPFRFLVISLANGNRLRNRNFKTISWICFHSRCGFRLPAIVCRYPSRWRTKHSWIIISNIRHDRVIAIKPIVWYKTSAGTTWHDVDRRPWIVNVVVHITGHCPRWPLSIKLVVVGIAVKWWPKTIHGLILRELYVTNHQLDNKPKWLENKLSVRFTQSVDSIKSRGHGLGGSEQTFP